MAHSPSDAWKLVEQFGYITVEDCIAMKMQHGKRHVVFQITTGGQKQYKQAMVANPLTMLAVIDKFRKQRDSIRSEYVQKILQQEQTKAIADYLTKQRAEVQRKHLERLAEEERRLNSVVQHVRKPIQAILQRVAPVIDPWAYPNVYGKPAEVFIF